MRVAVTLTLVAAFTATLLAQAQQEIVPPKAKVDVRGASYAIGFRMGTSLRRSGAGIDIDSYSKGLQEGLAGKKPTLSEEQMDQALQTFQQDVAMKAVEKNKQEGAAFLATNAKQPGVKTTKSGLQYKVLKDGTGPVPKSTDTVKTHYKGTLIDGTPFDSSIGGEPVTFEVTKVISGWTEALQLMKVGSKWQLYIPSALAYGPEGSPPVIAPNSTLIFEIELLGIEGQ